MALAARYAVLFKAFFIDDFVRRRLAHVVASASGGDVFLMLDETAAPAGPSDFPRTLRFCADDLTALGFIPCAQGAVMWYNADYPLYHFQALHPDYDYIVMIEYDAVPNIDLDALVRTCRAETIDLLAEPVAKPLAEYWWTSTLLRYYPLEAMRPTLICAAIFSARAVRHLAAGRLRQGRGHAIADAATWPIGEAFVGTELAAGGFKLRAMSALGRLTRYDWWPPVHEAELPGLGQEIFVHPVLTGRRYGGSMFKSGVLSGLICLVKFSMPGLLRIAVRRWRQHLPDHLQPPAARARR
jgi:hypothetical protein